MLKWVCVLIVMFPALAPVCYAQGSSAALDDTVKKEIAVFSISPVTKDSAVAATLKVIPLYGCNDSAVHFEKRNWYALDLAVSIYLHKNSFKPAIGSIYYLHYKYMLELPHSAFNDLNDPGLCVVASTRKKKGTSNCKVYRSQDHRRVYIYMLNGRGASRYEVTWIINDGKYYSRVINPAPEG